MDLLGLAIGSGGMFNERMDGTYSSHARATLDNGERHGSVVEDVRHNVVMPDANIPVVADKSHSGESAAGPSCGRIGQSRIGALDAGSRIRINNTVENLGLLRKIVLDLIG
jgi:hypothetical protein